LKTPVFGGLENQHPNTGELHATITGATHPVDLRDVLASLANRSDRIPQTPAS